jgi:predicted nucleotidyltransferase
MDLGLDLANVERVLREHGVVFALVFGSRARGEDTDGSDVDLAVRGRDPVDLWALSGGLPSEVDLVDLGAVPEGLAGRIALEGVVVLDDDPPARVRWQADTRKRHLDEAWRRGRFRRDFVAAHG